MLPKSAVYISVLRSSYKGFPFPFRASDFEYTPALTVFDLFRIPLYHGWVADPQDQNLARALGNQTYNQVVEMIIQCKSSADPDQVQKGRLSLLLPVLYFISHFKVSCRLLPFTIQMRLFYLPSTFLCYTFVSRLLPLWYKYQTYFRMA